MLLKDYIRKHGDQEAAQLLGINPRTAEAWRLGERRPNHENALKVVKATKGKVSYAECYGPEAAGK